MAEILTLTNPIDAPKTVFRVSFLGLDWESAHITIHVKEWTGTEFGDRTVIVHYTGPIARTIMTNLNKANLSTAGNSLHHRIITRLIADGHLTGSGSGTPD